MDTRWSSSVATKIRKRGKLHVDQKRSRSTYDFRTKVTQMKSTRDVSSKESSDFTAPPSVSSCSLQPVFPFVLRKIRLQVWLNHHLSTDFNVIVDAITWAEQDDVSRTESTSTSRNGSTQSRRSLQDLRRVLKVQLRNIYRRAPQQPNKQDLPSKCYSNTQVQGNFVSWRHL